MCGHTVRCKYVCHTAAALSILLKPHPESSIADRGATLQRHSALDTHTDNKLKAAGTTRPSQPEPTPSTPRLAAGAGDISVVVTVVVRVHAKRQAAAIDRVYGGRRLRAAPRLHARCRRDIWVHDGEALNPNPAPEVAVILLGERAAAALVFLHALGGLLKAVAVAVP